MSCAIIAVVLNYEVHADAVDRRMEARIIRDAVLPGNHQDWWESGAMQGDDHFFVAETGEQVVGYLMAEFVGRTDYGVIMEVATALRFQNQGGATALIHAFAERASSRACPVLYVQPLPDDADRLQRLSAFYERRGFRPDDELQGHYPGETGAVLQRTARKCPQD